MKLSILAALAIVISVGTATHTGCATSTCPTVEHPMPTQQATEVNLQRRIENALKDVEIFNARAFKVSEQAADTKLERRIEHALKDLESATARAFEADQERLNEVARKAGIDR